MTPTLKISSEQAGKRLDVVLARLYPRYSRAYLQKWIADRTCRPRQGKELIPNYRVEAGETLEVADLEGPSPEFEAAPKRQVGNDKSGATTSGRSSARLPRRCSMKIKRALGAK